MAEKFYNAFATPVAPVTAAETVYSENETGTHQKPPKLMYIEDFQGWKNRFENWVQAYRFDAWCSLLKDYERPKNERGLEKGFNDFTEADKLKYTSEKMMISILQQAVKEDIFVLLQHNGTARSIWEALIQKFRGSADMIKNKKALLKKSFDMFTAFDHETTKQIIDRYCHLVLEMGRLDIQKDDDEWVDKLAEALPQQKWGTYLMIVKLMRKTESMNLAQFIQKIEEQKLDIQKTAIMTNSNAKQEVSLYYRGNKFEATSSQSPKISTAFSADGSASPNASTTTQSGGSTSSFSSFDLNSNTPSPQKQNSTNLQCNVILNIQNGQHLSPEVAKQHMASLVAMLESYESLIAGRIGNPTIKLSTNLQCNVILNTTAEIAIEKIVEIEKVVEKIVEVEKLVEVEKIVEVERVVEVEKIVKKIVEVEKLVEVEKTVEVEKIIEKVVEVTKPFEKCSEACKVCEEKDKKIVYLEKIKEDLLSDVKYVKESYDVLNRTVDSLKRTDAEIEKANDKMSATLITKQSVINDYIEDCAKLKKELELEKIESLEAFKKKEKEEDTGKTKSVLDMDEGLKSESKSDSSSSIEKSPSLPVKRVYNKKFLLSKSNLNDGSVKVAYTLNDSDKLYSDEEFPIRSVKTEMIKKVFKLTEINISEIKDLDLSAKPKPYTSRIQQRVNKKMGYGCGYNFQKKPNHNGNLKKKGLSFSSSENFKNQKIYKPKTKFVSGGSSEDEQKKPFWKQSNQEFLAEVKKNVKRFAEKVDRRTCFKCQEVGHIAWNCSKTNYTKQGVSSNSNLKKTYVDKKEQLVKNGILFENSSSEKGESSKCFYKRRRDLSKQKWIVKTESSSDNESDSIKSEESLVDKKIVVSVPEVNDKNFPPLSKENLMKKVGKVEISNQFFADKGEFDLEKAFNGKVKHIFGKMVDRKVEGLCRRSQDC
ncbi:putative transcription factor interactor and regulator CCHC(Zn) family [Helianthus annuus]|nr:putative transcription factor interactor and regulator CCHC(Zn) family [Helianthus annuus]